MEFRPERIDPDCFVVGIELDCRFSARPLSPGVAEFVRVLSGLGDDGRVGETLLGPSGPLPCFFSFGRGLLGWVAIGLGTDDDAELRLCVDECGLIVSTCLVEDAREGLWFNVGQSCGVDIGSSGVELDKGRTPEVVKLPCKGWIKMIIGRVDRVDIEFGAIEPSRAREGLEGKPRDEPHRFGEARLTRWGLDRRSFARAGGIRDQLDLRTRY